MSSNTMENEMADEARGRLHTSNFSDCGMGVPERRFLWVRDLPFFFDCHRFSYLAITKENETQTHNKMAKTLFV